MTNLWQTARMDQETVRFMAQKAEEAGFLPAPEPVRESVDLGSYADGFELAGAAMMAPVQESEELAQLAESIGGDALKGFDDGLMYVSWLAARACA